MDSYEIIIVEIIPCKRVINIFMVIGKIKHMLCAYASVCVCVCVYFLLVECVNTQQHVS